MDKLERYRKILEDVVIKHSQYKPDNKNIQLIPICDREHDQYLLVTVGWNRIDRIHDIIIHLQLKDGKVWIEWDGIEYGVAQDIMDAGIPKEDIVLAFYTPEHRKLTDFAVA